MNSTRDSWTPRPVQLTEAIAYHGEGPFWDQRSGRLLWLDMLDGDLLETDVDTGTTIRHTGPDDVAALIRHSPDGLLLVGRRGIWIGDLDRWFQLAELPLAAGERANDGACSASGALLIGCMHANETDPSAVYHYDGRDLKVALPAPQVSNGLTLDTANNAWFIDSPTRQLREYRLIDAVLKPTGQQITTPVDRGVPDGMCRDRDGGFWVAMFGGGCVLRLGPNGDLDHVIELPIAQPTSCAFGGPDESTLYITTSAYGRPRLAAPAGAVFACPTPYSGDQVFGFHPSASHASPNVRSS